jgi:hypothetical protein
VSGESWSRRHRRFNDQLRRVRELSETDRHPAWTCRPLCNREDSFSLLEEQGDALRPTLRHKGDRALDEVELVVTLASSGARSKTLDR